MTPSELTFASEGISCHAWHFPGGSGRLAGPRGRPAVVMAHGFGGTKDSGLQPYAERFNTVGCDVLAFDYRGFGMSEGQPRQSFSIRHQISDYEAAVAAAKQLPGVDPDRIVLWGASASGAHVLNVAARRRDVVAVIAMTPLTDGFAAGRLAITNRDLNAMLRATLLGVKSRVGVASGREPILMPLVAHPGQPGAMALDGAYESYLSIAGPTWRNEIDAAVGLEFARIRTKAAAKRLRCRLLVQIADFDRYVPAHSVAKTATRGGAEVHHYPCDHFDVWPGHDWFDRVCEHQAAFLTRSLAAPVTITAAAERP